MKTQLKRTHVIVCIGLGVLALIIGAAGFLLAVHPEQSKAAKLDAEIAATQAKLASMHGRVRGPVIRAADLFQLARAMPDSTDMPGIVLGLAHAAGAASVKLLSIQPAATGVPQPDGATAYPIKVVVDGRWGGVTRFLHVLRQEVQVKDTKLSAAGRLFVVDNVQIVSQGGSSDQVEASINANAFTYGVAPPPVTDTSSTGTTTTTTTSSGGALASGTASAG